jgi:dipeptidyl aminopeptidase/acylaminoacyl peptidase
MAWSPDGRRLAVVVNRFRPGEGPRPEHLPGSWQELFLVDPSSGGAVPVPVRVPLPDGVSAAVEGSTSGGSLSWAPDSRRLVLAGVPAGAAGGAAGPRCTDVYLVEGLPEAPAVRALVARPGLDDRPRVSPDGTRVAFVSTDGAFDYAASLRLCTVAIAGGPPRCAVDATGLGILDGPRFFDWTPEGDGLLLSAAAGTSMGLFVAPAGDVGPGGEPVRWRRLDDGRRVLAGFHLARGAGDGGRLSFLATDLATPFAVHTSPLEPFAPRRVAGANPEIEALSEAGALPRAEEVRWRSVDGVEIEGLLLRPAGADGPLPLAVFVHGGGPSGVAARAFETAVPLELSPGTLPIQPLVTEGYAVFLPNYRGSGGYGEGFRRAITGQSGRIGSIDVDDVLSGVDALVERGIADPDRLAIYGMSHGSLVATLTLGRSGRFRAAAVLAGGFDLLSRYGEAPGFPEYFEAYFGGPPWEVPEAYLASSPLSRAASFTTPVLILHGDADGIVPVGQGRQLATALRRVGVEAELWIYPGEGHGFYRRDHLTDARRRVVEWFNRWLGGEGATGTPGAPPGAAPGPGRSSDPPAPRPG